MEDKKKPWEILLEKSLALCDTIEEGGHPVVKFEHHKIKWEIEINHQDINYIEIRMILDQDAQKKYSFPTGVNVIDDALSNYLGEATNNDINHAEFYYKQLDNFDIMISGKVINYSS